jgi:hypothetical protein
MSQFTKLFEAIEDKNPKQVEKQNLESKRKKGSQTKEENPAKKQVKKSVVKETSNTPEKTKNNTVSSKNLKKSGKSSNENFTQVLTYIRKETHKKTKKVLIDDPEERDLSDLVEQLLSEWLKKTDQG